jgi:hypothetical protein
MSDQRREEGTLVALDGRRKKRARAPVEKGIRGKED